jgi:hypothetical protein
MRVLLPPSRVDDVTGDLLETFRDDPALRTGSNRQVWWTRQVAGLFLRAYWMFPALLTAAMIWNDLFNTFRDANGNNLGPNVFTPMIVTTFLGAAILGGWRTRRVNGGIVAAAGSHIMTWSLISVWWAVTTYPFALSQRHNPYWINAWQGSAAPGESFLHWIAWDNVGAVVLGGSALMLLSLLLGIAGGVTGSRLARRRQTTSSA